MNEDTKPRLNFEILNHVSFVENLNFNICSREFGKVHELVQFSYSGEKKSGFDLGIQRSENNTTISA
jgi:hypothetical protein